MVLPPIDTCADLRHKAAVWKMKSKPPHANTTNDYSVISKKLGSYLNMDTLLPATPFAAAPATTSNLTET